MIPLLALAAAHAAPTATGVTGVVWAAPFTLATPTEWTMTADPAPVDRGILLELRADPALLVPREIAPVLYVGEHPAFRFNWDPVGGCAVVWVPGEVDLATTPVFFGSATLPERLDAAAARAEVEAARRAGARPLPPGEVAKALAAGGGPLQAVDFDQIEALAMARVGACSTTPSDLQRTGVPAR